MKTFIKNMTREQLKKVITDNENLQNEILEMMQENENFYIQEILDTLNLSNYNIDLYGYSFIKERDIFSFSESVIKAEKDYNIFGVDTQNYVKRLKELLEAYDKEVEADETNAIYDRLEELTDEIKENIVEFLKGCYDFQVSDIVNDFLEFNRENFENYYIKNNDFSKIYIMVENSI